MFLPLINWVFITDISFTEKKLLDLYIYVHRKLQISISLLVEGIKLWME